MSSDKSNVIFDTIAICGVGLIGGSLGMAAKRRNLTNRVIGIGRNEQKLMRAKLLGAIDEYSLDMERGAADADLVVVCTPVLLVVPIIMQMSGNLKAGAIVTDVGSTKREIVEGAEAVLPKNCAFVGGHPMAGSEQAGVEAARADLYMGATYVLTPTDRTERFAIGKMTEFVEAIGANAEIMSPEQHDAAVAIISHLPHAIAAALLQDAAESHKQSGKTLNLAAGSFRDLTRISDSPPEIWRDIFTTNADSIIDAIDRLETHLNELKIALSSRDQKSLLNFFEQAKQIRETYLRISK